MVSVFAVGNLMEFQDKLVNLYFTRFRWMLGETLTARRRYLSVMVLVCLLVSYFRE